MGDSIPASIVHWLQCSSRSSCSCHVHRRGPATSATLPPHNVVDSHNVVHPTPSCTAFAAQLRPSPPPKHDPPSLPPAAADGRYWRIVLPTALALLLCNMDRICLSVAMLPIAREQGWPEGVQGVVQSAFLWGYLATQLLGGTLADKYGGRRCCVDKKERTVLILVGH